MSVCSGIKADGGRCKGIAIGSSAYCYAHHPDHADARRRAARQGGKRGGRGRPQAELSDIKRRLSDLADGVLEERVDRGVGAVASQVLNVYLRAVAVELKAREQLEVVERLEALEEALERTQGGSRWQA
ncbi:MAG: hypothetical protein M3426_07015 [Actinomycetota bacterium]|jgi:hypothetical protein|nr:hypothetical protein [Actinomycetota bacterium]